MFNLDMAKDLIERNLRLVASSSRFTTSPLGFADQPDFVNTAFLVECELDIQGLKAFLKSAEDSLGRVRTSNKFGPRTIDLDIVVFNGSVVDEDVYERKFLKKLILEVSPEMKDSFGDFQE